MHPVGSYYKENTVHFAVYVLLCPATLDKKLIASGLHSVIVANDRCRPVCCVSPVQLRSDCYRYTEGLEARDVFLEFHCKEANNLFANLI